MLYGIFSDIHSNYEALSQVFSSMEKYGVERRICLGDIVGYGAESLECIDAVRKQANVCLLGNHDSVAAGMESAEKFNQFAKKAIEWTQDLLSKEDKEFLRSLPYMHREANACFVHASPRSPSEWVYVSSLDEAADSFDFFGEDFCFIGHTHNPVFVCQNTKGAFRVIENREYTLKEDERLLVNVGSVGQPRDRNSQASWCFFDSEKKWVEIVRVPYDIDKTQKRMQDADLPDFLIKRLSEGR
jgi:diadenosine tetraphosphatase ApaH/serine/threonine PP2A family protein phosphatase